MAEKDTSAAKPMAKTAMYKEIAEKADLEPKQVAAAFDALEAVIRAQLGKKGPGVVAIHNLVKFKLVKKPATKAGTRPHPIRKGEMMEVKAKPASTKVKATILKSLKEFTK